MCDCLKKEDVVFGSYRSHALYLAKGGDLNKFMAELYGKKTGCCKGRGGSMHLIDKEAGVMGTSAVVAANISIATGYAFGNKLKNNNNVAVIFFGDGATDEGSFYESINFACLHELPIIFICENNFYAIHSSISKRNRCGRLTEKVPNTIEKIRLNTDDVTLIRKTIDEQIDKVRKGKPLFIEILTYRWKEHVGVNDDFDLGYRTRTEFNDWKKRDSLIKLESFLEERHRLEIQRRVSNKISDAIEFAESSEFPKEEELYDYNYA